MAADPDEAVALWLERLEPLGAARARKMFGGWGVYVDDLMMAIVADGELWLKVDDANRAAFEDAGSQPFRYEAKGKRAQMNYWRTPEAALDDEEAFLAYARLALDAALRAARAKAEKAAKRTPKTA